MIENNEQISKTDDAISRNREFISSIPDHYGAEGQFSMAIEEMAELIQALEKHRRSKSDPEKLAQAEEHIAEEMADVRIMLEQLTSIFGNDETVAKYVEFKVERQKRRMAGEGI